MLASVKGLCHHLHVDLVGLTEIAEMLGVSRARAHQLAEVPTFPKPVGSIGGGRQRIWKLPDIERWARKTGRLS